MTSDEFTSRLPPFLNDPIPAKPPFIFNGLSSRVFPLRANMDALQRLCNGYLNFVPESVGRFRASVPYVFLSVLDYGQIAESAGLGWFAQVEVFFAVPVEWYRKVEGRWVFHDWATITPFIYVNDNYSVPLGRTVCGFPKVLSKFTAVTSDWIHSPQAPVTLASIETEVFPIDYAGRRLEDRVFLEVVREAPMSNMRVPFDPRSPVAPWTVASHLADAAGGYGRDALWLAQALRIFPQVPPGQMSGMLPEMLSRMGPALAPGGPGFVMNSLNLKQFRRADRPSELCYQALTNGPMITSAFNSGGLLGEERTVLGDFSGGHTIRLYEYPTLPIAKTLGLEVHRRWKGDGVDVAEFKPVLPFWMDVNVSLQPSVNLAWRTEQGVWKDGGGNPLPPDTQPGASAARPPAPPPFNPALASAVEAITGPFLYTGTTIRVLPLLASKDKLQAFLDESINQALGRPVLPAQGLDGEPAAVGVRLRVWARPPAPVNPGPPIGGNLAYVYMASTSFASVTSATNNVGDWAKYELAFLVPVVWERQEDPQDSGSAWVTEGVGVVPAYFFVDDGIAAASRYEMQGINARTADFVRPESVWLSDDNNQDQPRQTLLRMDAEVWAALEAGQQAKVQPVVEIVQNEVNAGLGKLGTEAAPFRWAEDLRLELGTKKGIKQAYPGYTRLARALALELLGNEAPLAMYSLKQFRDAVNPDRACYQSLVRVSRSLREVVDICEIEETLAVRIHDYPNLAIAASLGLHTTVLDDGGAGVLYSAQAIRPFYVRGTLLEPLGEQLMWRAGEPQWAVSDRAFSGRLSTDGSGPKLQVNPIAETLQDRMDPCRMAAVVLQTRDDKATISVADARRALALVDPQIVIDSVLSREWGSADTTARWRQGRQQIAAAYEALPHGGAFKSAAETALYRAVIEPLATRQGYPPRHAEFAEQAITGLQDFSKKRMEMEACFNTIAPWLLLGMQGLKDEDHGKEPDEAALGRAAADLLDKLQQIQAKELVGEPSAKHNLDMQVLGCNVKLDELLKGPLAKLCALKSLGRKSSTSHLEQVVAAAGPLREAVTMARRYCDAQREALLNTLSRAWQKPDFCIRRDSVGPERNRLLTLTGSWDEDWYYGMRFHDENVLRAAHDLQPPPIDPVLGKTRDYGAQP